MKCRGLIAIGLPLCALQGFASGPKYSHDIAKWVQLPVPPASQKAERSRWEGAAGNSNFEWRVYVAKGKPCANLLPNHPKPAGPRPAFSTKVDRYFREGSAFQKVDDGWLVGYDRGEWGGFLYWYSLDGKKRYKVSDDQIVAFARSRGKVYAIEGLAHLSLSYGAVLEIAHSNKSGVWKATTYAKLPYAPYTLSVRKDGGMLVVTSESLVSIGADRKVRTLFAKAPWWCLYPNSAVLTSDEKKLIIGMRQYVGVFDLGAKKLTVRVPSRRFLNRGSKDE